MFALCDGVHRAAAAVGAGLQARVRRRRGPEHRRHGRRSRRRPTSTPTCGARRARSTGRCSRARATRRAVRRRALRRADAHRDGPARARVQLPLRRPRDAVARCRGSRATCSSALAARAAGDARGVDARGRRRRGRDGRDRGAWTTPSASDQGSPIEGIEDAEATGALVFHAGTALHGDRLVTNGGRVLAVTGARPTLERRARPRRTTAAAGSRSQARATARDIAERGCGCR